LPSTPPSNTPPSTLTIRSTALARPPATAEAPAGGARDAGTAIVGTLVGFAIFILLLLFAVQVIVRLYATSTLTVAAASAAEQVADSPDPQAEAPLAVAAARQQLGTFGATRTTFVWEAINPAEVVLKVRGVAPTLLPLPVGWRSISRTVAVRTELFR
jgi:hypothetical protein